jgi:hypothetical protein
MELEKLIELVNQHHRDEGYIEFPKIVNSLPEKMKAQMSDIPEIDTEWVWQVVDQFDCYYGELAYKTNDGKFMVFGFNG